MSDTQQPITRARPLREIALIRTGDKTNMINLAVIPFDPGHYDILVEQLTCEVVAERYAHLGALEVHRYRADGISSLNFTVAGVLDGGVSRSLSLDLHGKSLGTLLALVDIEVPESSAT